MYINTCAVFFLNPDLLVRSNCTFNPSTSLLLRPSHCLMGGLAMNPGCDCVTMLPCPGGPSGLKPGCAKAGTAAGCVKGAPGTLKLCIPPWFQCDSHALHSTISLRILSATWKLSWSSFELLHSTKSKKVGDVWTYEHGDKFHMGKKTGKLRGVWPVGWISKRMGLLLAKVPRAKPGHWPGWRAWTKLVKKYLAGQKTRKTSQFLEISIHTSWVRVACKSHTWSWNWSLTLKFLKVNSGMNRRIHNPCRVSSACRLGGLKTVWRGTWNP